MLKRHSAPNNPLDSDKCVTYKRPSATAFSLGKGSRCRQSPRRVAQCLFARVTLHHAKVADAASDIMYGSTELAKETEHGSPASLCSCGAAGYAATAAMGLLCATQGKSW